MRGQSWNEAVAESMAPVWTEGTTDSDSAPKREDFSAVIGIIVGLSLGLLSWAGLVFLIAAVIA